MMKKSSAAVSVTTTTATGKPTATTGPISSLILPSSLVPYIWPSSPASFCTGVVVGLVLAFLRPLIEFYVDIGAGYISFVMRYILIWGSVAFIAWAILRTLQQTSAATLVINPESEEQKQLQQEQQQERQQFNQQTISNDQSSSYQQQLVPIHTQAPMPLPKPPSPQRQLLQYQHSDYDELLPDQPPILHMYDDEPEIEYVYERSRPGSAYSNSSSSQGRLVNGQYISSSASIYSDLTSSSSASSNNGNYYSPPIPQYSPYRKSPSPNLSSNNNSRRSPSNDNNTHISSAQQARIPPVQVSGRTSPTRKVVQSTQPVQPAIAKVNNSPYSNTSSTRNASPTRNTSPTRNASPIRSSARSNPASTSPTRRPIASNKPEKVMHVGVEPKIVSLDDDDMIGSGNYYRGYSSKIQQAHNIYGSGNSMPQPEGLAILEKPAGQSAFRLKRKP